MKNIIITGISTAALLITLWYMNFGSLTDSSGALSKTGLNHPVYFAFWGVLTFIALYINLLFAYQKYLNKHKFQYYLCAFSGVGMLLTITCKFDYSDKLQYYLHCGGTLTFSILTGICVFLFFLLNYNKNIIFKINTYFIGIILISDLICLLIFKENALIEAVPVLIALILLPLINVFYKEKTYVAR